MLRIDLLPEHYGLARKARLWIVIMAVILVIVALCWVGVFIVLSGKQAQRQAHLDLLKPEADAVRKLEGEASKIRGRIPQYGRKVDFIRSLEKPPEEYIDTLDKIAEYIFEGAQVTSWTISGSHASIDAEVGSTTDAGRFYINIRRCPAFRPDSIQISAFGASSARGGMMTGMEMMGGMPGMEMAGAGMPGMMGPPGAGGGQAASDEGKITVHIEADLAEPITIPTPTGGAAPMGGGRAGGMGGMMGGEMGMMGGGMMAGPEMSMGAGEMPGEEMAGGEMEGAGEPAMGGEEGVVGEPGMGAEEGGGE